MTNFSPREIVSELDKYIIGQSDAKRAVAIAMRNRWRRQQLTSPMKEEIIPKNILMIGPTGVGKTEISRRLARLADAAFIKVEATKFTEVGYVGRDVEQIIRDLLEIGITLVRTKQRKQVEAKATMAAEQKVVDALAGSNASKETKEMFLTKLRNGELDDNEIEIEVSDTSTSTGEIELPGNVGVIDFGSMLTKAMGTERTKMKKTTVKDSYDILIAAESDKLLDEDQIITEAIDRVENDGIVFLDEIDKLSGAEDTLKGSVSREGVQRDLLPLVEGTVVRTKHGSVSTDHILFIASGAFHVAKPSDLLPELQGRLPIRVELEALTKKDFIQILTEPEASLIKQYIALLGTEGLKLEFTDDAIDELAEIAVDLNKNVENIGARRLQTVMERVLDKISFEAADSDGQKITIDAKYVKENIGDIAKDTDLSRYVL